MKMFWSAKDLKQLCPKRYILKMNPVITSAFFSILFNQMKRKLGKEKSPAGDKLPEILHNGCKNHNSWQVPISL